MHPVEFLFVEQTLNKNYHKKTVEKNSNTTVRNIAGWVKKKQPVQGGRQENATQ